MNTTATNTWHKANQRYLMAALAVVREALEHHVAHVQEKVLAEEQENAGQQTLREAAHAMPAPSALDTLCAAFALSSFERDVLLLCAGMELDARFASLCATAQGDPRRAYPTFSLALAALPEEH